MKIKAVNITVNKKLLLIKEHSVIFNTQNQQQNVHVQKK